ncbi:MAG TPA: diguanylate cyclase [Myxococcota bacterium]|nr:diguanylate cyclase [Myxococcota bacterium]HRY92647.1 diguanylate cyclase [Myxococcota bacterium]HSA22814.1 diguanylate cyclase [Myxococcota bacterium]
MGLRAKIILVVSLVVALSFLGASMLTVRQSEQLMLDAVKVRGRALLEAMASPCAIGMANGDFESVDNYLGQVSEAHVASALGIEHVLILDERGRVYSHSDPTQFGTTPVGPFYARALRAQGPTFHRLELPGRAPLLEAAAPIMAGVRWGTLVVGFSLAREEATMARVRQRVLVTALGLAGASALVVFLLLTFAVLAPLQRLAGAAEALARGELERRLRVNGRDELAQLGRRFNHMAEELSAHTYDLENRVRERARDLIKKNEELSQVNQQLAEAVGLLEKLAITDGLTGLYNRRRFEEALLQEIRRNLRREHPFGLLMIDVDHFKDYNDAHGHQAGDEVLRRLAQLFHQTFRTLDLVARYGGEEFVVLLLETELPGARVAAEKIRAAVAGALFPFGGDQPSGRVTISVGVAAFPEHAQEPEGMVAAADQALYAAKHQGRNRVVAATRQEAGKHA